VPRSAISACLAAKKNNKNEISVLPRLVHLGGTP
jgi:hypothetical protein